MAVTEEPVRTRTVTRHFVTVNGRQVHYRRAGSGPAVVLRHESPRSSVALVRHLEALAPRFTAIGIDTPGYGLSEPLDVEQPSIADYAADFGPTLDALGIDRCAILAVHTGAVISLEFAAQHPERVSALVLEGVPIFTDEEREELIANYTPAFAPRIDGGHLAELWSFERDAHMYWPWYKRTRETRLSFDLSSQAVVESMHAGALDALRARPHYSLGYQAAFRYDALPALRAIQVPTTIISGPLDVLEEHLDRVPPDVSPKVRVERAPGAERVAELLGEHMTGEDAPPPEAPPVEARPGRLTKTYAQTSRGQLLVRRRSDASGRPLVMFHGSPGSAAAIEPLIEALAAFRPIVAFDTLGNGDSDKPDERLPEEPWIGDFAAVAAEAIEDLGLDQVDLFGTHTGALIAIETSLLLGERVGSVILDGITLFDEATTQDIFDNYFLDLTPNWQGTHLIAAWASTRDSGMWFPWYKRDREHAMDTAVRSAEQIAPYVLEHLKSGTTYTKSYRAAFRYPSRERLPLLRARTLICAHPKDPLYPMIEEAASLAPPAVAATAPGAPDAVAELYRRFLDGDNVEGV